MLVRPRRLTQQPTMPFGPSVYESERGSVFE